MKTQEAITQVIWTILHHPPYGLDLAKFSGAVKDTIPGKRFQSDDKEVIEEVNKWQQVQNLNWYKRGLHAFVSCQCKAVKVNGDCTWKHEVRVIRTHTYNFGMIMFK